jgi:FG-GAP repeat
MSGDTIVVGADGDSELGFYSGAFYVFALDGSIWIQQQKLHVRDASEGAQFGNHVAISGDTIVAGAPGAEARHHMRGAAYVFSRRHRGWKQDRKLVATYSGAFDGCGLRVAVSGDTIVVGSMSEGEGAVYGGGPYLYRRNGQSAWSLRKRLFASDRAQDDAFGSAVALSNNTVLVGALGKSDIAFYAGAAYVYEFWQHPNFK